MKTSIVFTLLLTLASARTLDLGTPQVRRATHRSLGKREVPQEHSHEKFLMLTRTALNPNNPDEIADPVFGLLGAAVAAKGAGKITDPDCLQQATADQAFTNAKASGDVGGMVGALVYRTLERNTGGVGLKSPLCTSITAVNPEIAALTQHQDPASNGAAAANKAVALELAVQINSVGGDPEIALQSGTFEPGKIGDPTAAGNTCNTPNDPEGCIFTQNLLVEDASKAEIAAAVAAGGAATAVANDAAVGNATAVAGGAIVDNPAAGNATAGNATAVADGAVNNPVAVGNGTAIVGDGATVNATAVTDGATVGNPAAVGNGTAIVDGGAAGNATAVADGTVDNPAAAGNGNANGKKGRKGKKEKNNDRK